jgi:hypothetical protein
MTIDVNRLKEIRHIIDSVWRIIDIPAFPTDTNRKSYMFSELDSLISILSIVNGRGYKECMILLRSILEKFLYFWLMFEGRKYRWTHHYFIEPRKSKTGKEARDKTLELWNNLKRSGDTKYLNWQIQAGHKDNVIIVTSEEEGMFIEENGKRIGEIMPIYNVMLEEYQPNIKHLSDIENMVNSIANQSDSDKIVLKQDLLYNRYFYINNIYRNLKLNNLVDNFQLNIIRIHYNFLSQYVHPSKYSIELWDDIHGQTNYSSDIDREQILKELMLLYTAKLIELYFSIFIRGYKNTTNQLEYNKFKELIKELHDITKEFWFYDNEPMPFDLEYSNRIKEFRLRAGKKVPEGPIYNENPFERLCLMRSRNLN